MLQGKGPQIPEPAVDDDDWQDMPDSRTGDAVSTCMDRWKNAGPEERKRMFQMYAECGIFLVACRHGTVLLVCDIIRSCEL